MKEIRHRTTFSDMLVARSGFSSDRRNIFVTRKDGTGRHFKTHIRRVSKNRVVTDHQIDFGSRMKDIAMLWNDVNDDFKRDLSSYTNAYNNQYRFDMYAMSAFNLFVKVLGSLNVQLKTIDDIVSYFGDTVSVWVVNGFLPTVSVRITFDHSIKV